MKYKKLLTDTALIITGCLIYAFGIAMFLDPNNLTPAGISGLAIAINYGIEGAFGFTPISTGTMIVLANVPIMLLGVWKLGGRFFVSTVVATALSSWFIDLFKLYGKALTEDLMLASILGGAFVSLGIGLVFRAGATTGGSDVIVRVLRTRYRHIKTGAMFWFIDGFTVLVSTLVFGRIEVLLYAIITLAVQTVVLDRVLYGSDSAKLIYIVSDRQEEISAFLLTKLETGVTLIHAKGAYTGKDKEVVMCVVKKQQLPLVQRFVREADPSAFMIVTKATEIFGEGYKAYDASEL